MLVRCLCGELHYVADGRPSPTVPWDIASLVHHMLYALLASLALPLMLTIPSFFI